MVLSIEHAEQNSFQVKLFRAMKQVYIHDLVGSKTVLICLLASLIGVSCSKSRNLTKTSTMVFLGHIYQPGTEDEIDRRLARINFKQFEAVLLGGDLCVETTKREETLDQLDDLFQLNAQTTHWALGNHDIRNGNLDWILLRTGRDRFYYEDWNSLRVVVMDTNLDDCEAMSAQQEMLSSALTEPNAPEHILILSHHAIWTDHLEKQGTLTFANAKHAIWRASCPFADSTTFTKAVYPLLLDASAYGKSIYWIAGDFGQKKSTFSYTPDGRIWFMGSGIDESDQDSILTLSWENRQLAWDFTSLSEFVEKYR